MYLMSFVDTFSCWSVINKGAYDENAVHLETIVDRPLAHCFFFMRKRRHERYTVPLERSVSGVQHQTLGLISIGVSDSHILANID
jgi:hypothetical protein